MRSLAVCIFAFFSFLPLSTGYAKSHKAGDTDPLAKIFGTMAVVHNVKLSPDGDKISLLMYDADDRPGLVVFNFKTGKRKGLMKGPADKFDISWCDWANDTRILCGFSGAYKAGFFYLGMTRLVTVNADGSKMKVLMQRQLSDEFAQFQDNIIDWLPDDPKHVLVQIPNSEGTGIGELNIYSGSTVTRFRQRYKVYDWISDGHGNPRLYQHWDNDKIIWEYRLSGDNDWHALTVHEADGELYNTIPLGFGRKLNDLLVLKPYKGHQALWAVDLTRKTPDRLVFARPDVDVGGIVEIGKYKRMVAVGYTTERSHLKFFDPDIKAIVDKIGTAFPNKTVDILDESWDKRYYLVYVSSDTDPGTYYRYDTWNIALLMISPSYPLLKGHPLAVMKPIVYPAADNTKIPGYLTLPSGRAAKNLPTIIMPHGGPHSRTNDEYNWLVQYLVARGYAVLQPNFRGSYGYGKNWLSESGWRAWKLALGDITDGANWLTSQGIADPDRMCVLGWSYGGYAALMSAVAHSDLYHCAVDIAGVSDPWTLIKDRRHFINRKFEEAFIGTSDEVLEEGSALRRADEIKIPVLMFHGERDMAVPIRHSEKMNDALQDSNKDSDLVVYDGVGHQIGRSGYRIDMLTRIGAFLEKNIGLKTQSATNTH